MNEPSTTLKDLGQLTIAQKEALRKGRVLTVADLLLAQPEDVAKRCRLSPPETRNIVNAVVRAIQTDIRPVAQSISQQEASCTTGDRFVDDVLGGGIQPGMIWEFAGQSAAGKTQLGLQISLAVQLPVGSGGLAGSACYITTSSRLPTSRLFEIRNSNPLFSVPECGLEDVHTMSTQTIPTLLHVLSDILPAFIEGKLKDSQAKPIKLLVIDALAELFHASEKKTDTQSLVQRSQNIIQISSLLHSVAHRHHLMVVVLNEVVDAFDRPPPDLAEDTPAHLSYSSQSTFFARADSIPGENSKEAALGLVWANQVNARILMSRTGRRRHLDDAVVKRVKGSADSSHVHVQSEESFGEPVLIRRMSVIFSSISPPSSIDYVVTTSGIHGLPGENELKTTSSTVASSSQSRNRSSDAPLSSQIAPLDVGVSEDQLQSDLTEYDDWDNFEELDNIPDEIYGAIDIDVLTATDKQKLNDTVQGAAVTS